MSEQSSTATWKNGATDDWSSASDWSTGQVPGNDVDVQILSGQVSAKQPEQAHSVVVGQGTSLAVFQDLSVSNTIDESGYLYVGGDSQSSPQSASVEASQITIEQNAELRLVGTPTVINSSIVNYSMGSYPYSPTGGIQVYYNATINGSVTGNGEVAIKNSGATLTLNGTDFTNQVDLTSGSKLVIQNTSGFTGSITGVVPDSTAISTNATRHTGSTVDLRDVTPEQVVGTGPASSKTVEADGTVGYIGATGIGLPNGHIISIEGYQDNFGNVSPADATMLVKSDGAGGTQVSWVAGLDETIGNGDFAVAGNWSQGVVPGPYDSVTLGNSAGTSTVTTVSGDQSTPISVNLLTQSANNTLDIAGELRLNTSPHLNGGTIAFSQNGVGNSGRLDLTYGGTLDQASVHLGQGSITGDDVLYSGPNDSGFPTQVTGLTLGKALTVDSEGGSISDGFSVVNEGTITSLSSGGGISIISGQQNNEYSQSPGVGGLQTSGVVNAGTITTGAQNPLVITADASFNQYSTKNIVFNTGTITAGDGLTIIDPLSTQLSTNGINTLAVSNSGTITLAAGTTSSISASTFDNTGTLTLGKGATLTVDTRFPLDGYSYTAVEFSNEGAVSVGAGASLTVNGNYTATGVSGIQNAGTVTLNGLTTDRLSLNGGTWIIDGTNPNDTQVIQQGSLPGDAYAPATFNIGDDTKVVLASDISTSQNYGPFLGHEYAVTMGEDSELDVSSDPVYPNDMSHYSMHSVSNLSAGDVIDIAGAAGQTASLTVDEQNRPVLLVTDGNSQQEIIVDQASMALGLTTSNDGNGGLRITFTAPQSTTVNGVVADGYISGATVFADANGDGRSDNGEISTTTDSSGHFTLSGGSGPLVAVGGTDATTGQPFTGTFSAPAGSTVITPLTTLVQAQLGASATTAQVQAAEDKVAAAFGIALQNGQTLDTLDPVAGTNAGDAASTLAYVAGAQVADTLQQIAAAVGGDPTAVYGAAVTSLAGIVASASTPVDLTNQTTIASVLNGVLATTPNTISSQDAATIAQNVAQSNAAVEQAATAAQSSGGSVVDAVSAAQNTTHITPSVGLSFQGTLDTNPAAVTDFSFNTTVFYSKVIYTNGGLVDYQASGSATATIGGQQQTTHTITAQSFGSGADPYEVSALFDQGDGTTVVVEFNYAKPVPSYMDVAFTYVSSPPDYSSNNGTLKTQQLSTPVTTTSVPCYLTGTLIRTARGEVAVEALAIGDLVVTASGAERPIKWIGHRTVDCRDVPQPEVVRPVCICAGAIAPGVPRRDLFVSPDHALFFDDIIIPAKSLINASTVQQVRAGVVTYYGLELDTHDMVIAEGLAAESYLDDGLRNRFDNYSGDGLDLDPSKAISREGSYRPLVINGARVAQVRSWVDARAERLGQPAIYGLSKADLAEDEELDRAGVASGTIFGCLERISREEISGWVWTEGHPNEPVLIEIDLDGVTVAALRSDEYRPDLHFAKIGVGRHGFRLRLPPASYQQRWMNVGVRVRSSGMHLTNSPAVIATETNETIVLV